MKKVKLTQEQADALDNLRGTYFSDDRILEVHCDPENAWRSIYECLNDIPNTELASALINGYEVEQTPEEKLREYYEELGRCRDTSLEEDDLKDVAINASKRVGIRYALNTLGIKIEGINAPITKEDE